MTPRKGKIHRIATVSCRVEGCERTHSEEASVAVTAFRRAGWTRRTGPRKTDGTHWRCPDHPYPPENPDERGYF